MNQDSITVNAFSPIVQCQDQPSEFDSDVARENAFLLSRGRSVLHAGCRTLGWQTPNARELKDCAHTIPRSIEFNSRSTLSFSQQCVHLSARTSTGPGRRCPRDRYHEGVGYSSLSIREVLYRRSGAFRERVVLLPALSALCCSEGGSQSTLIGQFYSEAASDKAQEGRGRHGTARRAHSIGTRSI
jgi:hypothetical protein